MTTRFCKGLKPGLYALTDSHLLPEPLLIPGVQAALEGGAVLVQYRDKTATASDRLRRALSLADLCRDAGVPLIINDDADLAKRCGAAGVHLGQDDGSVPDARALLGEGAIIGVTCHASPELARVATAAGADYLAFGRFYHSTTKPGAPAADATILTDARQFGLPVTAIGGVTLDNGKALIQSGADLLAVVDGLFGGPPQSVRVQAEAFRNLFAEHHSFYSLSSDSPSNSQES